MTQVLTNRPPTEPRHFPFGNLFARSLFDDWFERVFAEEDGQLSSMMKVSVDVAETDQAFEVTLDLPGVDPDDVDIQLDNNTLTIRGQRHEEKKEKDESKQYHRIERFSGSFSRSLVLPNAINESETAAEFKDGILRIVIPKAEDAKPRRIRIQS